MTKLAPATAVGRDDLLDDRPRNLSPANATSRIVGRVAPPAVCCAATATASSPRDPRVAFTIFMASGEDVSRATAGSGDGGVACRAHDAGA
jgi:hypothetical protein